MTDLEQAQRWLKNLRDWLETFDGMPAGADFYIDHYQSAPRNASLTPQGLSLLGMEEDVLGDLVLSMQLHFTLYVVLPKTPGENSLATENAEWLLAFQRWVIRQSVLGLAPKFGNEDTKHEQMRASGGGLLLLPGEDAAVYTVTLTAKFKEEMIL